MSLVAEAVIYGAVSLVPGPFAAKDTIALWESHLLRKYKPGATYADGTPKNTNQIKMHPDDWPMAASLGVMAWALWPFYFALRIAARPARWFFTPPVTREVEHKEGVLRQHRLDLVQLARTHSDMKALSSGAGIDDSLTETTKAMYDDKKREIADMEEELYGKRDTKKIDLSGAEWE